MTHVDFEIAKMLKEVGYDRGAFGFYHIKGGYTEWNSFISVNDNPLQNDIYMEAPDLNTAVDFLRDRYGLHIWTEYIPQVLKCWLPYIFDLKHDEEIVWDEQPEVYCLPTHPAALAAAITKACGIVKGRSKKD